MDKYKAAIAKTDIAKLMMSGVQTLTQRDILNYTSSSDVVQYDISNIISEDHSVEWIKIDQVGRNSEFKSHKYYSVMQKALFSCHRPGQIQVIFMIHGDGEKLNLYLGIRNRVYAGFSPDDSFTESLACYLKSMLGGTSARYINYLDYDNPGMQLLQDIRSEKYQNMYALTGIPSFANDQGEESLTAIDSLIGPLSDKKFVYYVVAEPINEESVSEMMSFYLDIAGKVESMKTAYESETFSDTISIGEAESISKGFGTVISNSLSRKSIVPHNTGNGSQKNSSFGEDANSAFAKYLSFLGLDALVDHSTKTITTSDSTTVSKTVNAGASHGYSLTRSRTIINKCAEFAAAHLDKHAKRFQEGRGGGMWMTGAYILTNDRYLTRNAAMQLKSVLSGKDSYLEPIRIHDISHLIGNIKTKIAAFSELNIKFKVDGKLIDNNFGNAPEQLTTVLTTKELSCIINLPQKSVPGISVVEYNEDFDLCPQSIPNGTSTIALGKLVYGGSNSNVPLQLPIDTLSRHALVCGVNGSGKTNTIFGILDGLHKSNRPFLVIEPAKTEYIDWAIEYNKQQSDPKKQIKIYMPGCERYSKKGFTPDKLKLNPFEVISLQGSEPRVLSHIDRLKSILAGAFPMQDILPVVIERMLYVLYTNKHQCIDPTDPAYGKRGFPSLKSIDKEFISDLMANLDYARENTQNISAALYTRFESLKYGWKKELLCNPSLTGTGWSELFGSPCVINLSYAGDDQDRAFIMSLMLQFLYEYRIAEAESGNHSFDDNICRHLVVVEEAHRVMARCENMELPQYKSAMMFSNFLSEVRAYGQGMMVVDQVPSRLIEDAIKNTNIKIIHKLVAADDSKQMAESIGLSEQQKKIISKLSVGQAVIAGLNSADVGSSTSSAVYLSQIAKNK